MKNTRIILASLLITVCGVAMPGVSVAQDKATAEEVVAKVKEAANALSKTGDLTQFNQKQSPWVWKDTYVFVEDCDKRVLAAHPLRADLIGKSMSSAKDTRGKSHCQDPAGLCDSAKKPSGVWTEYWWAKPGEKEASRKVSYYLAARGTPFVVAAGIYDDKTTIAELSKLTKRE